MARPLRHHFAGGWYHITARGMFRKEKAIESVRGERWDEFIGRHGDYGRDLALHIGRLKCGLTLRELGKEAGGMTIPGVAKACERMLKKLKTDRTMQRISAKVMGITLGRGKMLMNGVACRIVAGHDGRAARRTDGVEHVELLEVDAFARQPVQVGRLQPQPSAFPITRIDY